MNERQAKVIEAAKKSFSMFGYKATTVDQIAKIAGVGKGTIYTYFSNKEELLQAIVRTLVSEMRETADNAVEPDKSFSENLHKGIYGILIYRKEHALLLKLADEVREIGTQAAKDALQQFENEVVNYIKKRLDVAIEKGKYTDCHTELVAFVMYKTYISLVVDWEKNHEPLSNEEVLLFVKQYFLNRLEY
ncbi:TetR/AcrR family transcriptional regulator [Bacillus solimangrovi]|uniref:TetR family transcriptional regulator n=1 Tax=Bacillus solimangrovi TaxID=1305675 RepID=A0A1E5LFU2_9BACI|nr:TetR family transcriptional regulator [Bacillus solimangrovi]